MIILIGPSASGKTAVGKSLEKQFNIKKVVTYTTRAKRIGEIDGVDYHFISVEEFEKKMSTGFFFETMKYQNNYYGTSVDSISNDKYMILDLNGYEKYINSTFHVKAYYLDCDKSVREKRMLQRKDSLESIKKRLVDDDLVFSLKNRKFRGKIIDSTNMSIDEIAKLIYKDYKGI